MKGLALSVVIAVILIGVLGSLSLEDLLVKPAEEAVAPAEDTPSYFFEDFRMRVMDANGRPEYQLAGRELVSFRGEVDARIDAPRLRISSPRDGNWRIVAANGVVSRNGKLLQLNEDVVMSRAATATAGAVRIDSQSLQLDARRRIATGEGEVALSGNGWRVDARSVVADFERDAIDMRGDVRARFTPGEAP